MEARGITSDEGEIEGTGGDELGSRFEVELNKSSNSKLWLKISSLSQTVRLVLIPLSEIFPAIAVTILCHYMGQGQGMRRFHEMTALRIIPILHVIIVNCKCWPKINYHY